MKIGIDASRYGAMESTGVENYSRNIIDAILEINGGKNLVLYSGTRLAFYKFKVKNKVLSAKRLWTLRALSMEMRNNAPDSLFVPSHVLPLSLPKRNVITIHDVAFRHFRKVYSFFQYHYLNWSTKYAVKNADKIIVPSKATRNDLVEIFGCNEEKIEVIPHGFRKPEISRTSVENTFSKSEIFKLFDIHHGSKFLLFVGRLESKKNLVRLIEAFEIFARKHPDFRLILAGKRGMGFKEIWKKVQELKLERKVIMPGYVTDAEKAALFQHCAAFVFPSLYEGFGLPLLEAFYYEKPVLCSDSSSLPEVGGDAVCYVDALDSRSIAKGIVKIVDDKKFAAELVLKGRARLRKFSWKISAQKTLKTLTWTTKK